MARAQKPDFVFPRNGRVHLNRKGRQFSRLLAAEVCASAVVILDKTMFRGSERVLTTHSIRQFPLSLPLPCVTVCHHVLTGLYHSFLSSALNRGKWSALRPGRFTLDWIEGWEILTADLAYAGTGTQDHTARSMVTKATTLFWLLVRGRWTSGSNFARNQWRTEGGGFTVFKPPPPPPPPPEIPKFDKLHLIANWAENV